MAGPEDPRTVRSIAVTAEDVVSALEANRREEATTVLRITPPFSGRMRARLHRGTGTYEDDPTPVHVDPEDLVADPPPLPDPDETEDRLRADPDVEYTLDAHRERHAERIERWRTSVRASVVDAVDLDLPDGEHRVEVVVLG